MRDAARSFVIASRPLRTTCRSYPPAKADSDIKHKQNISYLSSSGRVSLKIDNPTYWQGQILRTAPYAVICLWVLVLVNLFMSPIPISISVRDHLIQYQEIQRQLQSVKQELYSIHSELHNEKEDDK